MPYLNTGAGRAREAAQAAPVALLGDKADLAEAIKKINELVAKLVAAGLIAPPPGRTGTDASGEKKREPPNKARRPPNKTGSSAPPTATP